MPDFTSRVCKAFGTLREGFAELDGDGDKVVTLEEFLRAMRHVEPPLREDDAEDVFVRLDTNRDSLVESAEFFDAAAAEKFVEPASVARVPITLAEYRLHLGRAAKVGEVVIHISSIDFVGLTDIDVADVKRTFVTDIAFVLAVPSYAVKDLGGNAGSVSLSSRPGGQAYRILAEGDVWESGPADRPADWQGGLVAQARIGLPPGKAAGDFATALGRPRARRRLSEDLSMLPGILRQGIGTVETSSIHVNVETRSLVAFGDVDVDHDGALDFSEFVGVTSEAEPPLTREQAEYAFGGLDSDRDGRLSPTEFEGKDQKHFDASITMADFKRSMLSLHTSPQDAFAALGAEPAGMGAFVRDVRRFSPPLTPAQAEYAFQGADADRDGKLTSREFTEVLEAGRFFPTEEELKLVSSSRRSGPPPAAAAAAPEGQTSAMSLGSVLATVVGLACVCACLCCVVHRAVDRAFEDGLQEPQGQAESYHPVLSWAASQSRAEPDDDPRFSSDLPIITSLDMPGSRGASTRSVSAYVQAAAPAGADPARRGNTVPFVEPPRQQADDALVWLRLPCCAPRRSMPTPKFNYVSSL